MDWRVDEYQRFASLRLRPALDLLARTPVDRARTVVDLGCGAGAAAPALRARFPNARLVGVDPSEAMRRAAAETGGYDALFDDGAADVAFEVPPELIFSNAALHWAEDHRSLMPMLFEKLAFGGALSIQMPRQHDAPSLVMLAATARQLRPDLFPSDPPKSNVLEPIDYARLLSPYAETFDLWETIYHQHLPAERDAHPVRAFTASTAARPYLEKLPKNLHDDFFRLYDAVLEQAYPRERDGGVWYPMRRMFLVATRPGA